MLNLCIFILAKAGIGVKQDLYIFLLKIDDNLFWHGRVKAGYGEIILKLRFKREVLEIYSGGMERVLVN